MKGRSLSGYQENKIWLNDGAGKFNEVAEAVGGSLDLDSRSVAFADLTNDGRLEVLIASQGEPLKIFKSNTKPDKNWVSFQLEGSKSNRSAIGASVEVVWDDQKQKQFVQSASGFSSQSQRRLHFGLGEDKEVDKAIISWPSGSKDTLNNPAVNQLHQIKENELND